MNNTHFSKNYLTSFDAAIKNIAATDAAGNKMDYAIAIEKIVELLINVQKQNKKVMMIGNGGSAGICSHMAVDYWKNGKMRATAFNDSSLLTCLSNDIGFEEVFSKPIEMFADADDVTFCISSSGKSKNILNGAAASKNKKCSTVTFSGFEENNPLRKMGDFNFYVPAFSYGFVEIIHNLIIHHILDQKMYVNDRIDVFNKNLPL